MVSREEADRIVNKFINGHKYPRLTNEEQNTLIEIAEMYALGKLVDYRYVLAKGDKRK